MKTVVIIQARMGSTRLPGKVLMVLGGKPVLAHVVERCKASGFPVVVATTRNDEDDAICQWCETNSIDYFRGDVDPLDRMADCAQEFGADIIVRVCADSPAILPHHIREVAEAVEAGADYSAHRLCDGTPAILTKLGLTCEALTRWCLWEENLSFASRTDREHVTKGIYTKPRPWVIRWCYYDISPNDVEPHAIDTQEDLDRALERMAVPV